MESKKKTVNQERPVFGERRDKMAVKFKDPEFEKKFRVTWLNDDGMTIQEAVLSGYEYVNQDEVVSVGSRDTTQVQGDISSRVSLVVSRDGLKAFLMKMERGLWEEQEAVRRQRAMDPYEKAIRGEVAPFGGQYKPSGFRVSTSGGKR